MVEVEYSCADGTPFPVVFPCEEDAAKTWKLELEHNSEPMPPLVEELVQIGTSGGERAYRDAGLSLPAMWAAKPPRANGYSYFLGDPMSPDDMAEMFRGCGVLVEKYGSALGIWRDDSLPLVKRSCAWLRDAAADVPVIRLEEEQAYSMQNTMISAMVAGNDLRLMTDLCEPLYPGQGELVAYELTQGYENETIRANQRLYELAQLISDSPTLTSALASPDPKHAMVEVQARGTDVAFFEQLDAFLTDYGWRSEAWSVTAPVWHEQGRGFWALVRQLGSDDAGSPTASMHAAAGRRLALAAEIEAKLAADEGQQARFRRRLERLSTYVAVREDRALWQLITSGSMRQALLNRGQLLVDAGAVDAPEDILFLVPDEVDAAVAGADHHAVVETRRAEYERRCRLQPPRTIGGEVPSTEEVPAVRTGDTITGVAAARGETRGTARVITDLAEADRLEPGDILVCVMTAPPWTPLFAIASAVICDTGALGSHPAIAAREYGIPCVLSTRIGTRAIPDGATVVVNGAEGTVRLA